MRTSPYVAVSGTLFGVIAIAHIVRLIFGWPVEVAGRAIPVWFSAVGLVLGGALCLWALRVLSASSRDAE